MSDARKELWSLVVTEMEAKQREDRKPGCGVDNFSTLARVLIALDVLKY